MPTKKKTMYNNGNVYKIADKWDNTDNVKQMIRGTFKIMEQLEDLVILHKHNKINKNKKNDINLSKCKQTN